ncbi:GNAT family N-acetyltransferase [Sulfitobacter sp. D35]|uniref:GNAT family N-acetyltransferase n=1 Tax=Sulfitobacter sp. D35 TaxID=3083252 RepID=UPI00296E7183|nr:GNAT family N-acetyltransferase [Sulfitobacter sp. D35]MDW4500502.1 GNAT family N-acetyltransferase [Sulfitobacter sp. D35]
MTTHRIAPTVAEDIPGLQRVLEDTGLFPPDLLPEMFAPARDGDPSAFWLTCHLGSEPVGLCYTRAEEMADGTWNMLALGVASAHRRSGLGAALVAAAEERLREQGQRMLLVDTSGTDDFAAARAFYEGIGYAQEARIRDFWAPGDDKITFRKSLTTG